MDNSLNNLRIAMDDIETLLSLSSTNDGRDHKNNILRSAVVLMVASWEQFVEQLAENSVITLVQRLRSSEPIPEGVKQSIAIYFVKENRSNKRDFSNSVWQVADKGWKSAYVKYCKDITSKINSASSDVVDTLYESILGIRNITSCWSFNALTPEDCTNRLDDLVNMRHDIAHGANNRASELTDNYVNNLIEFIIHIASQTHETVHNHTTQLSCEPGQALSYSLTMSCYVDIISLGVEKQDRILTIREIKSLGSSAQGNHNKLRYEPWSLLEVIDGKSRRVTDRLISFYNGEIRLPLNIFVFDNGDAIPAPNTGYILFSEMQANQSDEIDEV